MIDVNKITSTLAKLPDAQLQQYAQMHKADPYIMALAMSESNRRKEMRAAGQGAQGMQEQPKVVDQMVAEMAPQQLPEDQGIGQLNAGNMNFAGGGIIAFADGGDVERYSGEFGSFVEGIDPLTGTFYMPEAPPDTASMRRVQASPFVPAQISAEEAALLRRQPAPVAAPKVVPVADTGRKGPGAGLGAAAASREDPFSMASIKKAQTEALGDSNYKIGELNNQLVDIRNKAETQVQQRLGDRKKEIEAEGDVYKDRSDRLVERAKSLAGQKDQNTGLALLNAGLAIMSTPGGLMTAIGKGAQVGTAQYAAGIKDLRAAQERLDEANDRISELRMNRKDLNSREIRALEKDRDAAILDGQKMVFGFAKDVYGMDRKQAEAAFSSYMSGQEKKADIQSRERISKDQIAAANRTPEGIQTVERIMAEKKIPFSEALAYVQGVKREPMSVEKLRGDWLDAAKRVQIAQDYPNVKTFDDYLAVMNAGGAGGAGGFKVVGSRPGP